MDIGYFIGEGDKTTCGGKVLDGDNSVNMYGLAHAREGDRVSCGKDGNTYKIVGGVSYITSHGRLVAGTLDSYSNCPCKAELVPSIFTATYHNEISPALRAIRAAARPDNAFITKHQLTEPNTVKAQEVKTGQPVLPIAITVNDRAATREAIIRKVRSLGHQFVERSEWGAQESKGPLSDDWDYSMIALHHAGRSYACGNGAQQMLRTQAGHQSRWFDDIGYHFGIDCSGVIYEGRDIRFKGSSVELYNTGVIGVVLLNNLTVAKEGDDLVAYWRESLESYGMNTTHQIPAAQVDATVNLITALKSVFVINRFGGHREFPNQNGEGKICPGNIGMELVKKIRIRTQLLAPPTS